LGGDLDKWEGLASLKTNALSVGGCSTIVEKYASYVEGGGRTVGWGVMFSLKIILHLIEKKSEAE